jgi:hypothetical protein
MFLLTIILINLAAFIFIIVISKSKKEDIMKIDKEEDNLKETTELETIDEEGITQDMGLIIPGNVDFRRTNILHRSSSIN